MIKNIILFFIMIILHGCTTQRVHVNVIDIKNVCSSDIDLIVYGYVSGSEVLHEYHARIVKDESKILLLYTTADRDDRFKYEGSYMIYKDKNGNLDYPFILSQAGRSKSFGKNDLIRLARDISSERDKRSGGVRYIIDSMEICP